MKYIQSNGLCFQVLIFLRTNMMTKAIIGIKYYFILVAYVQYIFIYKQWIQKNNVMDGQTSSTIK